MLSDLFPRRKLRRAKALRTEFVFTVCMTINLLAIVPANAFVLKEQRDVQRRHYEALAPMATRDPSTNAITVDLDFLRQGLVVYLQQHGLAPVRFRVFQNGEVGGEEAIAGGAANMRLESRPANSQQAIAVELLDARGRLLHVTNPRLFESLDTPLWGDASPVTVKAAGPDIDSSLITTSAAIQQQKGSWYLRSDVPTRNPGLYESFLEHGSKLEVTVAQGSEPAISVFYRDPVTNRRNGVLASPADFYFTANADFSWHLFDWDRWVTGRYLRFYKPWLAKNTVDLALATQQNNGAWWRELTFNLKPYQRPYPHKVGRPLFNKEAFNPPLAGWAVLAMLRWNPKLAGDLVPRMGVAIQRQREWLERESELMVKEGDAILGFHWSSLGSGRDNAYRGDLFVDLLTYYKMLLDQERILRTMQGQIKVAGELLSKAEKIAETLNSRYWDEGSGMYVDLVKNEGAMGYRRDRTLNAIGFWPMMANVPNNARLARLLANLHNPKRFGGAFLPSLARDDPRFQEIGSYWRGGGWPPDFVFLLDGLMQNALPSEARRETLRMLTALKEASNSYKLGHTPDFFVSGLLGEHAKAVLDDLDVRLALARYPGAEASLRQGAIPSVMATILRDAKVIQALAKHPDTIWETIGLWMDGQGKHYVSWGKEVRSDGTLHKTRGGGEPGTRQYGFAGWGAVSLEAVQSGLGFDGVAPLLVSSPFSASSLLEWYHFMANDPFMKRHEVWTNSRLLRLRHKSLRQLKAMALTLREKSELQRVAAGYLTLSPTYDPGQGQTRVSGLNYAGIPFAMDIDRLHDDRLRLTVTSEDSFPLQVIRHWTNDGKACNAPLAASSIVQVGGKFKVVDISLTPAAWRLVPSVPKAQSTGQRPPFFIPMFNNFD